MSLEDLRGIDVMGLEDLLDDKQEIAAIDALGSDVRDTIEEAVKKYSWSTALDLRDIARYTNNKEAVIQSAKTIGRYDGNTAWSITCGLRNVAENTRNKGAVRTACRIVNLIGGDAFDLLEAKDFNTISAKRLDELIGNKENFYSVTAYIKSSDLEMPAPTKRNIGNYEKIASKYVSKTYGINKKLNTNEILMLFSIEKYNRKELIEFINGSNEIGFKTYSISTKETKKLEVDRSRLPYLSLIAVTGSRDKALDKEAYDVISSIVGEKAIRKARTTFNSNYKSRMSEIVSYVNKGRVDKAIDSLRATKNESIDDVLGGVHYSERGFTRGKAVLSAVESNNPIDYDNRVQIACVYLPRNFHDGIYNYCKDYYSKDKKDGFLLVRYDIGGKTLGSAICYMENDTFLVDSVEGHRTFRKPQVFKAVYQDLVDRANEKGAKRVIFSEGGINETPNNFIKFLGNLGLERGDIKMKLDTEGYLEAGEDGVGGYIVNLNSKVKPTPGYRS